ncbi:MAG: MaoC family dehydratase N-terminal domain-containing protein [Chloroflexi bacterium]|nr:MaoC family dehydratase N-terminal domain-containing protein [Chloroflexota bacterium]
MGLYYEDLTIGMAWETQGRTVGEAEVALYAGLSGDFHRLHTDEQWARANSPFGGRVAHGILGIVLASGLFSQLHLFDDTLVALLGFEQWKFSGPIRFGDTLRVRTRIAELRRTSTPGRGLVKRAVELLNQRDEVVQSGVSVMLVRCREEPAQP